MELNVNLVNNLKYRIISSFLLIAIILIYYFFHLSFIFLVPIIFIIHYEIYKIKIIPVSLIYLQVIFYLIFLLNYDYCKILLLRYISFAFPLIILFLATSIMSSTNKIKFFCFNFLIFMCLIFCTVVYESNHEIFFLLIIIASINDILAYLFGNLIKGPKISKIISPNKTWSGTSISFFISFFILNYFNFHILFSFAASLLFFYGDIYFSYFKRIIKIKDYGTLIKGHGGVLDRIDSSIFTISLYLIFNIHV